MTTSDVPDDSYARSLALFLSLTLCNLPVNIFFAQVFFGSNIRIYTYTPYVILKIVQTRSRR